MQKRILYRGLLLVVIFFTAIASERFYFSEAEYKMMARRSERVLDKKVEMTRGYMNDLYRTGLDRRKLIESFPETVDFDLLRRSGITLLAYSSGDLNFWSDKSFDVPFIPGKEILTSKLLRLQNGYFIKEKAEYGDTIIVGLIRVYNDYDIENNMVRSGFPDYLKLPSNAVINTVRESADYSVRDDEENHLFSIEFSGKKENTVLIMLPVFFWALFFLLLILLSNAVTRFFVARRFTLAGTLIKVIIYSICYASLLNFRLPAALFSTELFVSTFFFYSRAIPSMGHLLILSIFLFDLVWEFNRYYFTKGVLEGSRSTGFLGFTFLLFPGTALMIAVHQVVVSMALHPNIIFEGYRIDDFGFLSVAGILSALMLVLVPAIYSYKIIRIYQNTGSVVFYAALFVNLLLFPVAALFSLKSGVVLAVYHIAVLILLGLYARRILGLFNLMALFSLLFALYSTWYITASALQKEQENMKVMAVSYSTSHDEVAEYLLYDISLRVNSDTVLESMMMNRDFSITEAERLADYLADNYFNGYWTNYDFSVIKCDDGSLLYVNEDKTDDCFSFFDDLIRYMGREVTGTSFYHIETGTGRPSYMGLFYYRLDCGTVNGLFVELTSFVNAFREGFPELLIDRRYMRSSVLRDYSFGKYIDGTLVLNTGEFSYWKSDLAPGTEDNDFVFFEREGFFHVVYRNGDISVMLSRPVIPFTSRVVSFAYMFVFSIIVCALISVIFRRREAGYRWTVLNFRQKLQAAFISIILVTFAGIATGAGYLSIEQYRDKHYESLREKAASLNIELEHKLIKETYLDHDWSDGTYNTLSELLVKFSNVYFTDLSLYDKEGMLLATSRPEIFMRDLTSRRMDKLALLSFRELSETEYITWARTGDLEYISIYIPFFNEHNELLAYLNIPYFGMQSKLAGEISNLIVAIINFSLLMILAAMSLAVFISERITSPIRMMGDVLASVKLGQKIERLSYTANDEIGDLVKQYNKMVEELEESARKLSANEREYAWREMARQIAHEIKNPLTPMKLNVQQLEKSWRDGKPGFEKRLEKFTRNQIEYIDNLSSIATAFSSFARMPKANPSEVDIVEQLKITLELFRNSENTTFRVSGPGSTRVFIFADSEHLNSVFSNLVKNAIQAIPAGEQGVITIAVTQRYDRVVITISDNGCGIPDELQKKLFTPYFTTKSSGSGLGLNIVKRLVETIGGEISFQSISGEGTTFTISLPVLYTVENGNSSK